MKSINLIYTVDNSFFDYLAVSIDSISECFCSYNTHNLNFYIVQINFSEEQKKKLVNIIKSKNSTSKVFYYNYKKINRFNRCRHKSVEILTLCYYLPNFFPTLDRAIYIDADTLFLDDIKNLWNIDLEAHWIATNPCILNDISALNTYNIVSTRKSFESYEQTINAGIMILDLKKMRQLNITKILDEWTEKNQEILICPEQEAIAINFPKRKLISHKWNWRGSFAASEIFWTTTRPEIFKKYLKITPSMIHLQGPLRPDIYIINSKYFELWIKQHKKLQLSPLTPKKLDFLNFTFLFVKNKSFFIKYVLLFKPEKNKIMLFTLCYFVYYILIDVPDLLKSLFNYFLYYINPYYYQLTYVEPAEDLYFEPEKWASLQTNTQK